MNIELPPEDVQRPGEYIDRLLHDRVDLIKRACERMHQNPSPIPEKYTKMCHEISGYAIFEVADTNDAENNQAAHMTGLQWGYALVAATRIVRPIQLAIGPLDSKLWRQDQYAHLKEGVEAYTYTSVSACQIAEDCCTFADPNNSFPLLTRRGIMTGLYMADLGLRQLRVIREKQVLEDTNRVVENTLQGIIEVTERQQRQTEAEVFRLIMRGAGYNEPGL